MEIKDVKNSKIYKKVLDHRAFCGGWLNGKPCLDCFGGGLIRFFKKLINEFPKEEIIICQCGFKTSIMSEMINHIEEEGNTCRKFIREFSKRKNDNEH